MAAYTMTFLLLFATIPISDAHIAYGDVLATENGRIFKETHPTTSSPSSSEILLFDGLRSNFLDGFDGSYLTDGHHSHHGDYHGHRANTVSKRRWSENSMSVWGKRNDQESSMDIRSSPYWRRMWSENSMSAWGKRKNDEKLRRNLFSSAGKYHEQQQQQQQQQPREVGFDGAWKDLERDTIAIQSDQDIPKKPKRVWAKNSMSAWGKRKHADSSEDDKSISDKAEAASDNELDTRRSLVSEYPLHSNRNASPKLYFALLSQKGEPPKRNWATNTMNVWGK